MVSFVDSLSLLKNLTELHLDGLCLEDFGKRIPNLKTLPSVRVLKLYDPLVEVPSFPFFFKFISIMFPNIIDLYVEMYDYDSTCPGNCILGSEETYFGHVPKRSIICAHIKKD